jgi:ammonia channel protein AmtB
MRIEMVSGFLLPAGVWLIVSAGMPLQAQRRLASATLIALATSLLTFAAFGFALAFGGIGASVPEFANTLNAPIALRGAQDIWVFAGATGFLLDAAAQASVLALFVQALPLVLVCAVLMAGALAQRARPIAQLIVITVTCGIALPLAGGWLWANGWLHTLGAMDLGQLSVVGLVAGGAGLAWLRATPRREVAHEPQLPEAHLPSRAIAGVLLVLAGMTGVLMASDADVALRQFVNAAIAVAAAIITAGAYTAFTTRNADTLSASRAMLAAVFVCSAGAATLPTGLAALLGVACGLLATLGFYWVNEKRLLHDESALVTSVLAPAAAGMLMAGAFAGAGTLIAQVIALVSIALPAYGLTRLTLWLAGVLRWPVLAAPIVVADAAPLQAAATIVTPASTEAQTAPATGEPTEPHIAIADEPLKETAKETVDAAPQKRRGLLAWLRREQSTEVSPKQPRKVAYPYRIGGRRMAARPVASETPPVDSASTIDAS